MEQMGFEIVVLKGDPQASGTGNQGINDQRVDRIVEFAASICPPAQEYDALFCSCTAWRSMAAAAELEQILQKPVPMPTTFKAFQLCTLSSTHCD